MGILIIIFIRKPASSGTLPSYHKEKVVVGDGFEPSKSETADLQSAPFGHFGIPPPLKGSGYHKQKKSDVHPVLIFYRFFSLSMEPTVCFPAAQRHETTRTAM